MNWFVRTLTSSIGRKLVMSLTGLFLVTFLIVHVSGNFQLFKDDGGYSFNMYSRFMTHNPIIKTISYLLYTTLLVHSLQALLITLANRKSRPQGYVNNKPAKNSKWASRNMGILGSILLLFLVIHLKDFWAEYHWGDVKMKTYIEYVQSGDTKVAQSLDEFQKIAQAEQAKAMSQPGYEPTITDAKKVQYKDLYSIVAKEFEEPGVVFFYVLAMIAVLFHLMHGFSSAFQSLGLRHVKYDGLINGIGWVLSVFLSAGFASMPLYFLLK